MVLSRSPEALTDFIETLLEGGVSKEAVYADLLAPAARRLGEMWDEDKVSYTEVTIGLGRLQQMVHGLDWLTPYNGDNEPSARSALFAPRPGEQQTFGFYLIEEMFRWSGWRTWVETSSTNETMTADARCHWFDILCLSIDRRTEIREVASMIAEVRRASRNRDLFVLVTGRPFIERPELIAMIGADGAAASGGEALRGADAAVRRPPTD